VIEAAVDGAAQDVSISITDDADGDGSDGSEAGAGGNTRTETPPGRPELVIAESPAVEAVLPLDDTVSPVGGCAVSDRPDTTPAPAAALPEVASPLAHAPPTRRGPGKPYVAPVASSSPLPSPATAAMRSAGAAPIYIPPVVPIGSGAAPLAFVPLPAIAPLPPLSAAPGGGVRSGPAASLHIPATPEPRDHRHHHPYNHRRPHVAAPADGREADVRGGDASRGRGRGGGRGGGAGSGVGGGAPATAPSAQAPAALLAAFSAAFAQATAAGGH